MPPETSADIERRLTEIRDDVRELKCLLVGTNGEQGALDRLTTIEQRHGFLHKCYVWLAIWVVGLTYMLVPAYFRQKWEAQ